MWNERACWNIGESDSLVLKTRKDGKEEMELSTKSLGQGGGKP